MMKADLGVLMALSWLFQAVFCLTLLPDMSAKRLFCVCASLWVCFHNVDCKCWLYISVHVRVVAFLLLS